MNVQQVFDLQNYWISNSQNLFFEDDSLIKLLLLNELIGRTEWVNEMWLSRNQKGQYATLFPDLLKQETKFYQYFRMSIETFRYIYNGIKEPLTKYSNFRDTISAEEKLMITLRFLATGMSYRALSFCFRMADSTICLLVYETCNAIWEAFYEKHLPPTTTEMFLKVAQDYYDRWNFPNCIGAIDGKHIALRCPANSHSQHYNYKGYFSNILQAIVDANCKFVTIHVGGYGRQSDGGTFRATLYEDFENGTLGVPENSALPHTDIIAPYVLVGDEAYPLKTYLMKPYSRNNLDPETEIFNFRLSRARKCVECAFGILAAKWRCLKTDLELRPDNVDLVTKTCCLLHNIIIDQGDLLISPDSDTVQSPGTQTRNGVGRRFNHSSNDATQVRNLYKNYFNSTVGAIRNQYGRFERSQRNEETRFDQI